MKPRRTGPLWFAALLWAVAAFVVTSFLPLWTEWWVGDWEANGDRATFWEMIWSIPRVLPQTSPGAFWSDFYGPQFCRMVTIWGVTYWFSFAVIWWRRGRTPPTNRPMRHNPL